MWLFQFGCYCVSQGFSHHVEFGTLQPLEHIGSSLKNLIAVVYIFFMNRKTIIFQRAQNIRFLQFGCFCLSQGLSPYIGLAAFEFIRKLFDEVVCRILHFFRFRKTILFWKAQNICFLQLEYFYVSQGLSYHMDLASFEFNWELFEGVVAVFYIFCRFRKAILYWSAQSMWLLQFKWSCVSQGSSHHKG